ncbi:MAG: ABC transporter ATP-binding protein [Verrucomicrobiales bacterium]|nr:ABC transporter ATP-binding protein [Verrucomicrobiales bacterium]MCP5560559.1 ABC transporter ATP-binding protein [Verrucomicrobiaceae bacterium]
MAPSPLRRLLSFAKRHWRIAAWQLGLAVLGTLLILVFPGVVQWFIDDIIPNHRTQAVWTAGGLAIAAFLIREILFYARTRVNCEFEQRMITDLRGQLHRKIVRLPVGWFDRQSTGDILTRMADDVPSTQRVILEGIEQGVTAVLQMCITAIMMFVSDWRLALIILAPTPLIAAGGWIYSRWVAPRSTLAREATSALNSTLHDTIAGIRQVKSYTAEDLKQQDFLNASDLLRKRQTHLMAAWAFYSPSMTLLGNLGLVLLLMTGAWWCIDGEMTAGELMKFLLLVGFLYEPIARLHGVNQTLQNGLSAARRVFEILDRNDAEDLEDGSPAADIKGHVRFENITFAYNEGKPVLRNVSLEVPARQTIAVVGATGSGKTTLFQLLARFYDAEQGQITLDDKPLQYYAKTSLRQTLSYVTQDAFLFAGTIRGNLLLGCPSATEDQLWEALRLASAEDFVRAKTDGLDSQVGERGVMLSGGERQRIAMARAFLKDAPILLLDEATSAVDTKSEHAIQAALDALRKDRTCMVIAHRLSTVIAADQIYVLRLGEIVAHGSHEELLKSSPYYAELAALAFDSQKH